VAERDGKGYGDDLGKADDLDRSRKGPFEKLRPGNIKYIYKYHN